MIALRLGAFLLLTLSFASGYAPHSAAVASFEVCNHAYTINIIQQYRSILASKLLVQPRMHAQDKTNVP